MNILFLSRWFPYPPDNGARIRIFNLLRQVAARHTVDLISFHSEPVSSAQLACLQPFCRTIRIVPYQAFTPGRLKAILGLFSPYPRSVVDTDSPEMHAAIQLALKEHPCDLVIATQVDMAQYARHLPVAKILEEVELATLAEQAQSEPSFIKKARRRLMWQKWAAYMTAVLQDFDGCTVVSEPERRLLAATLGQSAAAGRIQIIPNGVDAPWHAGDFGDPVPNTLVFTGNLTYSANFDAMLFFLAQVFPILQQKCPDVRLSISGKLDGVALEKLPRPPGVTFTGYLEDIRPLIARSWASIVPLRIGGGTRLKILESLAIGTPVISTRKGAEGLDLAPGQDVLIADQPAKFAGEILRLFASPALRQSLSQNGRQVASARYDWQIIGQSFCNFISANLPKNGPQA